MSDEFVREIREVREEMMKEFDDGLAKLFESIKRSQEINSVNVIFELPDVSTTNQPRDGRTSPA